MNKIITKLIQFKSRTLSLISVLLMAVFISSQAQAVEPPHGYERLGLSANNVGIKSDFFIDESLDFIYDHYANALLDFVGVDDVSVKDKRLIDIEVHITGVKPKQEISLSGIWIENKGFYEQESWLTMNLTSFELNYLLPKQEFIPLDIEKYMLNGQVRYSVIWQRNVHEVDWEVSSSVGANHIFRKIDEGYRVVEFDQYRHNYNNDPAYAYQIFDAILVENTGDNYLNASWETLENEAGGVQSFCIDTPDNFINCIFDHFKGFFLNQDETIIDVEFLEFPGGEQSPVDPVFPYTWALVITHPVGACENDITQGSLVYNEGGGVSAYNAQDAWGRIIDLEDGIPLTHPFLKSGWYAPESSTIHAC